MYSLSAQINGYDPLSLRGVREIMAPRREWRGAYFHDATVRDMATGTNRANLLLKRAFWLHREYVRGPMPDNAISFPATTTCYISVAQPVGVHEVSAAEVADRPYSDGVSRFPLLAARHLFTAATERNAGVPLRLALPREADRAHGDRKSVV